MQTEQKHNHHIVPIKTYLLVFAALMVLMVITIGVAFLDLGALNTPIALTIAVTKATLIMAFFMHLKYSSKLTVLVACMGFFWLAIMMIFIMGDYLARGSISGGMLGPQSVYNPWTN
jgi:cytochrome c oxidase subunit 4